MLKVELEGEIMNVLQAKGEVDIIISDVASLIDEVLSYIHKETNGKYDKKEVLTLLEEVLNSLWKFRENDIKDLKKNKLQ